MFSWNISKQLLFSILEDKVSDRFVCELIRERLFYKKENDTDHWYASYKTPVYWSSLFRQAPLVISERKASVYLTRSIDKINKQGLKDVLGFSGYKISELYPRRTRRATAVNWLICWSIENNCFSNENSVIPIPSSTPVDPAKGHFGDPEIK